MPPMWNIIDIIRLCRGGPLTRPARGTLRSVVVAILKRARAADVLAGTPEIWKLYFFIYPLFYVAARVS